jgi:hypothetical protein
VLEEVRHRRLGARAALELEHDADVVGALVPHVDDLRDFLRASMSCPIFSTSLPLFVAVRDAVIMTQRLRPTISIVYSPRTPHRALAR